MCTVSCQYGVFFERGGMIGAYKELHIVSFRSSYGLRNCIKTRFGEGDSCFLAPDFIRDDSFDGGDSSGYLAASGRLGLEHGTI